MFRKSGYIKEHEKVRSRSSKNVSFEIESFISDSKRDQFNKEDIEQYQQNESKSFFMSHEEEAEQEK